MYCWVSNEIDWLWSKHVFYFWFTGKIKQSMVLLLDFSFLISKWNTKTCKWYIQSIEINAILQTETMEVFSFSETIKDIMEVKASESKAWYWQTTCLSLNYSSVSEMNSRRYFSHITPNLQEQVARLTGRFFSLVGKPSSSVSVRLGDRMS